MKAIECLQHFSHCKSMGNFSDAQGQITPHCTMHGLVRLYFQIMPDFMVYLVTCKNEEDSIKNDRARVFTTLFIDFLDAQGQITP